MENTNRTETQEGTLDEEVEILITAEVITTKMRGSAAESALMAFEGADECFEQMEQLLAQFKPSRGWNVKSAEPLTPGGAGWRYKIKFQGR